MRPILFEGAARRWSLGAALLATLTILLINFAPSITAQDNPRPPHWFWGNDLDQYVGDQVVAINQDGVQVGSTTVESRGEWTVTVSPEDARTVRLRLISDSGTRATDPLDVMDGGFDSDGLSISDFRHRISDELEEAGDLISVRIIAQRLEDGRIEFGMRNAEGEDVLPRARKLRVEGRDHEGWARSSLVDFGDGFQGFIIARVLLEENRVEFGFRVTGYDDFLPRARKLAIEGRVGRWARSTPIEIPRPR